MKDLDAAWKWYTDAKASMRHIERVGRRCWDIIPWDESPWRNDNVLSILSKEQVIEPAQNGLEHLDDLAVVVLFSVFEATVRGVVYAQVAAEEQWYQHRAIADAIKSAKERIDEGSFFAVLNPFKTANSNLIEEVHQVRHYRNWVSHGKRKEQPPSVNPKIAYDRLKQCLELLFPAIPDDRIREEAFYIWERETSPHGKHEVHWHKAKMNLQELVRTGQLRL